MVLKGFFPLILHWTHPATSPFFVFGNKVWLSCNVEPPPGLRHRSTSEQKTPPTVCLFVKEFVYPRPPTTQGPDLHSKQLFGLWFVSRLFSTKMDSRKNPRSHDRYSVVSTPLLWSHPFWNLPISGFPPRWLILPHLVRFTLRQPPFVLPSPVFPPRQLPPHFLLVPTAFFTSSSILLSERHARDGPLPRGVSGSSVFPDHGRTVALLTLAFAKSLAGFLFVFLGLNRRVNAFFRLLCACCPLRLSVPPFFQTDQNCRFHPSHPSLCNPSCPSPRVSFFFYPLFLLIRAPVASLHTLACFFGRARLLGFHYAQQTSSNWPLMMDFSFFSFSSPLNPLLLKLV